MKMFFTIGEISKLFGVGIDSIRYYEKIGLISPKRKENRYRLYSINDIWRLNVIRDLRRLNFSMERIKQYITDKRSVMSTLELLEEELSVITAELLRLSQQHNNVVRRMATIQKTHKIKEGVIFREKFGARHCYMIKERFFLNEEMDVYIQHLLRMDPEHLFIIGNDCIGARLDRKAVEEGRYNVYDATFIIDKHGETSLPGGEYICVAYRGSYSQTALYTPKLFEYAKRNNMQPSGDVLELMLIDIHQTSCHEECMTELQLPVTLV